MSKKIDIGYEFNYWKLSYRRKFLRTLWILPLCIVAVGFMLWNNDNIFAVILVIIYIIQLSYNFIKWKKGE